MSQTTLLQFWSAAQPSKKTQHKTTVEATARETLTPHYIRPIPNDPRYAARLEEEYALIDKNQFARVFLQVRTILSLIETIGRETKQPIPHVIRGSAGSSLVCYLLGITHIDPIRYGIELARFMNRCRTDIPDIDIDVPYNRRDEIYGRIAATWEDQVARVSNHVMWKLKTATRESAKEVLKDKQKEQPPEATKQALQQVRRKHFQLNKILPDKADQEDVKQKVQQRLGTLRSYSKHCGGIVIFEDQPQVPPELQLKSFDVNGARMAQLKLNKDQVEDQGLIKIDVLSNRGLAQLAEICPTRALIAYPVRDGQTERIFAKGLTLGVTFGESRGMRRLFVEMAPRNVEEIAIALALIRPAAASEGRKMVFLEKWKQLNATADRAADDSAGLLRPIVFDDDAILKIRKALRCDAAEADRWRKAFAKGNAQARVDFRRHMMERGYSRTLIDTIVDDLNQLVYYSFCKSHALSYAQLVWALAYWKVHHPHAFWCASLNHCHSEFRKWVHYREALLSGLQLSRAPPPYILGTRGEGPVLIAAAGEQTLLFTDEDTPQQALRDMRTHGYWLTKDFLPSCGMWQEAQQRLDGKHSVRFRGLIATSRVCHRDHGIFTLLCIGVGNGEFVDLVIANESRADLFRYAAIEGTGLIREGASPLLQTIDVQTIRGVSMKRMLASAMAAEK